ncbi:PH domain-containing protein [Tetragenococcus halophilus]|uniref:PH domain-containing protein n=1 Tax=Tetragenococcus halophilus TaxID=51669 RepID=UPI001F1C5380|nr:PH domain-containing protein [Tetragenococcus halophilus]MCF1685855.1 PH domain-containing protein [Tetragenococcus halophilus]
MNQSTKIENIIDYVKAHNIDFTHSKYVLYGRTDASNTSLFLFGGLGALSMKQYIMILGENYLTLILLSMSGDFKESFTTISYDDIFDISFKEGILTNLFIFRTDHEKIKIRCNKKIMGMPWQSTNMQSCLAHPVIAKYVQ